MALEASLDSFLKDALEAAKQEERARDVLQRKPRQSLSSGPDRASSQLAASEDSFLDELPRNLRDNNRDRPSSDVNFDSRAIQAELLGFSGSLTESSPSSPSSSSLKSQPSIYNLQAAGEDSTALSEMRKLAEEERQLHEDMKALLGELDGVSSSSLGGPQLRPPSRPKPSYVLASGSRMGTSVKPTKQIGPAPRLQDYRSLLDDATGEGLMTGPRQSIPPNTSNNEDDLDDFTSSLRLQIQRDGLRQSSAPPPRPMHRGPDKELKQASGSQTQKLDMLGFLNDLMMGDNSSPDLRGKTLKPSASSSSARRSDYQASLPQSEDNDNEDDLSEILREVARRDSIRDGKLAARPPRSPSTQSRKSQNTRLQK